MSRRKLAANELKEIKEQAFNPDEKLTVVIRRLDYEVFRNIVKERLAESFDTTEALLLTDVLLRIEGGIQQTPVRHDAPGKENKEKK